MKFRRQAPVGPYIADFLCISARLVIEVDGDTHADSPADARRTEWLRTRNLNVLRFTNRDVLGNLTGVLETIASHATSPVPS